MSTMVKNAASKKQVQSAEKQEKADKAQYRSDVRAVLSLRAGRNWIWHYLESCHIFTSSYGDAMEFKEGERNIGLQMLADINEHDPAAYLLMLKENRGNNNGE